VLDVWYE